MVFTAESPSAQGQPVVPKIVRVTGAAFPGMNHHNMGRFLCASLFTFPIQVLIMLLVVGLVLLVMCDDTVHPSIIIGGKILLIIISRKKA